MTRTPLCQVDGDRGLGLGGFSFADVFNTNADQTSFQCSSVCDSTSSYDTMQCDRLFACNHMACTMDSDSDAENLAEFLVSKACPVTLTDDERDDPRKYRTSVQQKREQWCQTCTDCGHLRNSYGLPDWGRGCASECSISQCDLGEIWDWTRRACVACDALRNGSLCTSDAWNDMKNEDVSGHRAKIAFRDCVAKPKFGATVKISYGDCGSCRKQYINESCAAPVAHYHASCSSQQESQCQPCHDRNNVLSLTATTSMGLARSCRCIVRFLHAMTDSRASRALGCCVPIDAHENFVRMDRFFSRVYCHTTHDANPGIQSASLDSTGTTPTYLHTQICSNTMTVHIHNTRALKIYSSCLMAQKNKSTSVSGTPGTSGTTT